jgi:ribosomal-protein-serine acetyltransferase
MVFRPIEKADAPAFHVFLRSNFEHIRDYFPKTAVGATSLKSTEQLLNSWIRKRRKREIYVFIGEDGASGKFLGLFFSKEVDLVHMKCEIAYFVDKDEQGKGLASAGVKALIRFIFSTLELNKIICRVSTDNEPSIKVAEKNGFILEGVLKKEFKISSGKFIDVNCYGLLK